MWCAEPKRCVCVYVCLVIEKALVPAKSLASMSTKVAEPETKNCQKKRMWECSSL